MLHVHGRRVQVSEAVRLGRREELIAVAIDVGKASAVALVADFAGERLVAPFSFAMNRHGVDELVRRVRQAAAGRVVTLVRVGVEAAGHYHRPLTMSEALPLDWEIVEFNPAHVTAQRRVNGQVGVKTDPVDAAAIYDLLVAGRGYAVGLRDTALVELTALAAHRERRMDVRTATKNQLLGQIDRCFPGASGCVASLLDTKVGMLVVEHFTDPARLARLGTARFRRFAAVRDVRVSQTVAERFVAAAKAALPTAEGDIARHVVTRDLQLLAALNAQIEETEDRLARLLPATPFQILTTGPAWRTVRASAYGAAVGDPARWPGAKQIYRAAGLTPRIYESAGHRRDGAISREGSVKLRRALLNLGLGLWHHDPAARVYAKQLRERGKPGGIIACAMANRANRIAYVMVREQAAYDPSAWRDA
jgi:transposase